MSLSGIDVKMGDLNKPLIHFKTNIGKVFRHIANMLHSNFTTATMIIVEQGIFIQEAYETSVIFECKLESDKFLIYNIPEIKKKENDEDENPAFLVIGFNTQNFKKSLEKVGVSDTLEIYIHPSNTAVCNVKISKGSTASLEQTFSLVKTSICDVVPPPYVDYLPTTTVLASEFKAAIGGITKSKQSVVLVSAQKSAIFIKDQTSQISQNGCKLGAWDEHAPILCSYNISLTRLASFVEVNSISPKETIRIYALPNLALRLAANAGGLGVINMYFDSIQAPNEVVGH